jgi:hypothetical protein
MHEIVIHRRPRRRAEEITNEQRYDFFILYYLIFVLCYFLFLSNKVHFLNLLGIVLRSFIQS